jgi:hypothetical protein
MMAATRDDKPDWFRPPPTVTSAIICRLSGKLATDGCTGVTTVDDHGNLTVKSMVYTDYFVRGTEPVEYCPLHDHAFGSPAVVATTGNSPEPVRAGQVVPPAPGVTVPPAAAAAAAALLLQRRRIKRRIRALNSGAASGHDSSGAATAILSNPVQRSPNPHLDADESVGVEAGEPGRIPIYARDLHSEHFAAELIHKH